MMNKARYILETENGDEKQRNSDLIALLDLKEKAMAAKDTEIQD
jgi:hypothetical protein